MDRRLFLMLVGSAATSPAHEWLIAHTGPAATRATGTRVPMEVVDHLDQITARLRRMTTSSAADGSWIWSTTTCDMSPTC